MDNNMIHEAVDNISFIKDIIEKTKETFHTLSKIFILWGILFIFHSVYTFTYRPASYSTYVMIFNLFANLLFVGIATGILLSVIKKSPLLGLEKQLLFIWILILLICFLPVRMRFSTDESYSVIIRTGHYTTLLCGLGVSLIVTWLFTRYKPFLCIGAVYIVLGFAFSFVEIPVLDYLQYILLPATFLYTGISLKRQSARGKTNEH